MCLNGKRGMRELTDRQTDGGTFGMWNVFRWVFLRFSSLSTYRFAYKTRQHHHHITRNAHVNGDAANLVNNEGAEGGGAAAAAAQLRTSGAATRGTGLGLSKKV